MILIDKLNSSSEPKSHAQILEGYASELSILEACFRLEILLPIQRSAFDAFFDSKYYIQKSEGLDAELRALIRRMQDEAN